MSTNKIPFGPNYDEMLNPQIIDQRIREQAIRMFAKNELDPINLFNINWKEANGEVRKIVLSKKLTGVDANIIVLLGNGFPSGSHKVGPAYATLIEGCVDGTIIPGKHTILGPSTGNFGIGTAYICRLMGYEAIVIMPDNMSKERYDRIKRYGGKLELTPGSESDVILTLEKTYELKKQQHNAALAQFELMPNYRFHRFVTGNSCIEAVKGIGNGRVACYCSAPGSAGTLAAGDQIKKAFPECKIAALEPHECATLTNGGLGQHRIEGIGDKMVTLIHNVLNTDFVVQIIDEDCVKAMEIMHRMPQVAVEFGGLTLEEVEMMGRCFGISTYCNILGAIKMAEYLRLGPDDNIVTIATDGADRYETTLDLLETRYMEIADFVLRRWAEEVFHEQGIKYVKSVRSHKEKEILFKRKEAMWVKFGYTKEYMDSMKTPEFWDREYEKVFDYNEKIKEMR